MLSLLFLFVTVVHFLMADWSEAYVAIERGQLVLDRIRVLIARHHPSIRSSVSVMDHDDDRLLIRSATFRWDDPSNKLNQLHSTVTAMVPHSEELHIEKFRVSTAPNNRIIGIIGSETSGKSSLVQALLGQMPLGSGTFQCNGPVVYYPPDPYILCDDSTTYRQNICWPNVDDTFDEQRYADCLATVQLCLSAADNGGHDRKFIDRSVLNAELLHKIVLARALYNTDETETIVLDVSPVTNISDIFAAVVPKLTDMGKSVIVLSNDDTILQHCSDIYILRHGQLSTVPTTYAELTQTEDYANIRSEYQLNKNVLFNMPTINMQQQQTCINVSDDNLMCLQQQQQQRVGPTKKLTVPVIFNAIETFYLMILCGVTALCHVVLPVMEILDAHLVNPCSI